MTGRTITAQCPSCKDYSGFPVDGPRKFMCSHCGRELGELTNAEDIFDRCPLCGCRQFYLMKDFNQFLGCMVMLAGIVLVPFTFGLSLPVFALVDWLIYRRVPTLIVCYRCAAAFSGFEQEKKRFKSFMHHIGLKYDKYR